MVPAAVVDGVLESLLPLLDKDDIVIDGGNSSYHDDIRRAADLAEAGIHYMDVGTSGGVAGLARGSCLMIGDEADTFKPLEPVFAAYAPGAALVPPTTGRTTPSRADLGYLHTGPPRAGKIVRMKN